MIPWYNHILEQNSALKMAFSLGFDVEVGVKYKIAFRYIKHGPGIMAT